MPHIEDVGNPERTVLEEMRSLAGDLEWVMVIKEVCVERSRCWCVRAFAPPGERDRT